MSIKTINPETIDDRLIDLLPAAAQGDRLASGTLLLLAEPRLRAYIRQHMPARLLRVIDEKDVLQDTFIEALRRLSTFTPSGDDSFHRWLVTMARRQILQLLRAHRAVKRSGDRYASIEALLEDLAFTSRTPSRSATGHEIAVHIEAGIAGLAPDTAAAIRMRYLEQLSFEDISRLSGKTERAAQMLCSRGLKQLRERLRSLSRFR